MKAIDEHLHALPRRAQYEDVDVVSALAARQDVRLEQLGRGRMRSSYALLTTHDMHVSESTHTVGAIAQGAAGKGLCILGVSGEDGPERSTGGRCSDGDCVLVRSGQEYVVSSRRPFRALAVVLSQSRLERACEVACGTTLRAIAPGYRLGLADPGVRWRLHQALRALLSPEDEKLGVAGLRLAPHDSGRRCARWNSGSGTSTERHSGPTGTCSGSTPPVATCCGPTATTR